MRRLTIVLAGACVLIGAAHTLWWRWAERQLVAELNGQAEAAREAGWTVSAGRAAPGGWPFAATLTVPELLIAGGQGSGAMTWSTDRLVLGVGLWRPLLLSIDSEGSQRLHLGGWPEIPYTADVFHASVPLQVGTPPRGLSVHLVNLRAGLPFDDNSDMSGKDQSGITVRTLDLRLSWTPAAQQNEAGVSAVLSATSLQLPADTHWPLGPTIAAVSADLALNGPLPRAKGLAVLTPSWATAWRDGGGNLEIGHIALDWGTLALSGNATVALDEQMQPMGAGVLHVTDPDATLVALREGGAMTDRAELAARALVSLMVHTPADGGKPTVDLPITLQDRRISISRFGVARIPQIAWPGG